jgi:hypothetical protein
MVGTALATVGTVSTVPGAEYCFLLPKKWLQGSVLQQSNSLRMLKPAQKKNQHAKTHGQFGEKRSPVKLVSDGRLIVATLIFGQ